MTIAIDHRLERQVRHLLTTHGERATWQAFVQSMAHSQAGEFAAARTWRKIAYMADQQLRNAGTRHSQPMLSPSFTR